VLYFSGGEVMLYKLLIVEDEYEIRKGLINQVSWHELGFEIAGEAENGSEALDMLSSFSFDAIISDIRMPVMDGIELMRNLRESNSKIKIVILSSYNEFEYAKKSIQYEAFSYILKPTRDEEIYDVFRRLKIRLDGEYNINREYESYREKAQVGLDAIKSNLLRKLVENKYEESEREIILENLIQNDISINDYMGVISCQTNNGKDIIYEEMLRNKFYESILHVQIDNEYVSITDLFISNESDIICLIISSKIPIDRNESIKIAETVKENLERFYIKFVSEICTISIGIGNFFKNIFKIHESYMQSKRALNLKFFLGLGKIAHINDYYNFKKIYSTENNSDTSDGFRLISIIADSITELECNCLKGNIYNCLNYIRMQTLELEQVYIKAIEMIMILNSMLFEKDISLNGVLMDSTHTEIQNIIFTGTFNDLLNYLNDTVISIVNYVARKTTDDECIISQAKKFIDAHYSENITLIDVSRFVSLSPTYFSYFFKQKTGHSFIKYLTSLRIEKAKELLRNPDSLVKEVAMNVGYNDIRHFSKTFKKIEGIIPSEFKYSGLVDE